MVYPIVGTGSNDLDPVSSAATGYIPMLAVIKFYMTQPLGNTWFQFDMQNIHAYIDSL